MRTVLRLAGFEARYQLRRVSAWVYFFVLGAIAFLVVTVAGGAWDADSGSRVVLVNSPLRIASLLATLGMLAAPVTAATLGNAVYRDFQTLSYPLFFTTRARPRDYLLGRYLGAVGANFVVLLGGVLGILIACAWPGMDPDRVGPMHPGDFLRPLLLFVLPNLLFTAALFFSLAALTRRMLPNYVGGVALLVAWGLARLTLSAVESDWAAWLLDPFAGAALQRATRYWTVVEQNTLPVPLVAGLLANRALWLGVGAAVLAGCVRRFRFAHAPEERPHARGPATWAAEDAEPVPPMPIAVPAARRDFSPRARRAQLAAETRRAVREVVNNVWFRVLAGLGVLFVLSLGSQLGSIYGTATYPVTYQVLELVKGTFMLFVLVILAFYAGELVWHERELRAAGIYDSLPVPTWVPLLARTAALLLVVIVLLLTAMACGVLMQAGRGWFRFEIGLYLYDLFVHDLLGTYLPLTLLAVLIQTVVNHKYVGHFVFILYVAGSLFVYFLLGFEHNLLVYASTPTLVYSDMNGFEGERAWWWFALYWAGVAALLAIAANLLWVRGQETGGRRRLRLARRRATRPVLVAAAAAGLLVLGTGGFIFYNTNVLNDWETRDHGEAVQADYEHDYKRYETVPQPRITAARLAVDIFPERRDLRVKGAYRLKNRTAARIDSVHVDVLNTLRIHALGLDRPATRVVSDKEKGYYIFRLATPLLPGDSAELRFDVEHDTRGFENEPSYGPVVGNGTFFDSEWLPSIGYNASGELEDEGAREEHGLPPRPRAPPLDDPQARLRNDLAYDADWMDFEVTVSTSADQTAVAPGYLQRTWTEGGRRYFHYRMDAPMLNFFAFLSARYRVRKDRWNGVAIEVYHDPRHPYNVERMIRSVQASLDYYTREFGPYQHRQVRILEFPRYREFAQSFDNTIPYSEAIGFIADVRADDIDYPYFVTAHEVAHQWWGHQVAPAHAQGSAMLSETLAEYSALMVMEKEYGRERIGRFLRYELDQYLQGRGGERRAEMPLMRVEYQSYIHYNKGALAMYALRDYIGEETLNGALRDFLREWKFRGPPYPTARDLVRRLYQATPDSLDHAVADLFEHVTLYENRAVSATARQVGSRWEVTLTVEAAKLRADELGGETHQPLGDWIDIGVFATGREAPVYLRKHRITQPRQTITVTVDERPARAGIDPLHKLIDRRIEDNTVRVSVRRGPGR